jgi:hypothetical protein
MNSSTTKPRPPLRGLIGAWVPLLLLVGPPSVAFSFGCGFGLCGLITFGFLYLGLPCFGRFLLMAFGRPLGECNFTDGDFRWYVLHLVQSPFARVPLLEDFLRLIPGLYQLWLCLWGSRVSVLSVWGPGVVVTDRWAVDIGPGAIIGAGAILGSHLILADGKGGFRLLVAPVFVEAGAVVGGRAGLAPGSRVSTNENFPALQPLPPGQTWREGRRIKSLLHSSTNEPANQNANGETQNTAKNTENPQA